LPLSVIIGLFEPLLTPNINLPTLFNIEVKTDNTFEDNNIKKLFKNQFNMDDIKLLFNIMFVKLTKSSTNKFMLQEQLPSCVDQQSNSTNI
jgi:hypothetical protein